METVYLLLEQILRPAASVSHDYHPITSSTQILRAAHFSVKVVFDDSCATT
jgi:hypothetical protein